MRLGKVKLLNSNDYKFSDGNEKSYITAATVKHMGGNIMQRNWLTEGT